MTEKQARTLTPGDSVNVAIRAGSEREGIQTATVLNPANANGYLIVEKFIASRKKYSKARVHWSVLR